MSDGTAQGGSQAQEDVEPLLLRARPRPVTRFNRRVIIGASALVCVVIVIATLVALQPIRFREQGDGEELFNTEHKTTAEVIAQVAASNERLSRVSLMATSGLIALRRAVSSTERTLA